MEIIREHYVKIEEKPEVIEDWLIFLEGAICNELLNKKHERPLTIRIEFSRELFDEKPENPALTGLIGYRVVGKLTELTCYPDK